MAKRRLISLLPAYNQTDDLKNFFGCTVDEAFQPGNSEPISGYIGRRTASDLPGDFYVGEPTVLRNAYQLEAGMVSYDANKNLINALSYLDFIAYLQTAGAVVNDQQRLTETDYYSYGAPINIDMLVNYHQYHWFGDLAGTYDHPILTLTVPFNKAVYDGSTQSFALPDSILAVPADLETPTIFVLPPDDSDVGDSFKTLMPSSAFNVVGNTIELVDPPVTGSTLVISRVPSLVAAISGQTGAVISDINDQGVTKLSSGMRIKVIDAVAFVGAWDVEPWDYIPFDEADEDPPPQTVPPSFGWDFGGNGVYMVDGVGLSMRLTSDDELIRDTDAQYVTIDRSSLDHNLWSLHNLWVHRDTFTWAKDAQYLVPLTERQAKRPIVEFIRDIKLWFQQAQLTTTAIQGTTTLPLQQALPNLVGREVHGNHIASGTLVTQVLGTNVVLSKPILDNIAPGATITFRQAWVDESEAITELGDPLFMLYDLNGVPLNDIGSQDTPGVYPASNFTGNTIFDYALNSTGTLDSVLLRPLMFDANGYYVFEDLAVTHRYTYDGGQIGGLYLYGVDDGTLSTKSLWNPAHNTTPQGVTNGFFDIPLNLQANPSYEDVTYISRSTWTAHFASIIANQSGLVGQPMAANNYRDTRRDLTLGTGILQHVAPLLKAMLLASTSTYDLPQAIRYASQEYTRFRNKFLRKLIDLNNNGTVLEGDLPLTWVTTALRQITRDKTSQFPFALNSIGGDQYFIPPTPACLGIQPAAVPALVVDTTYDPPLQMVLGHDGSLMPAYSLLRLLDADVAQGTVIPLNPAGITIGQIVRGTNIAAGTRVASIDASSITLTAATLGVLSAGTIVTIADWRDPILLALEQVIYDNLPQQFQTEARPRFDVQRWTGGRFYSPVNGYSNDEVNILLTPMFELWAQQNRLDYRSHNTYNPGDPFTWNFRGVRDVAGNSLPGSWRAIYRWYFDTDEPHLRPWECLGFVSEPSWWVGVYGTDYSSQNTDLWADLEAGAIQGGPRMGVDLRYARPGLSTIIPVDANGKLLDPVAAGIVTVNITLNTGARGWLMGDIGPVEALWRDTPSYRFALAIISFLMKPARFVEECWDLLNIGYVNGQWVELATYDRPLNAVQFVHGEINDGSSVVVTGISQWIADYMLSAGHKSDVFGTAVRGLDVRLIHQMAGFTSTDDMQVVADNFGLLPSEDVAIVLYTSPITDSEVYSGVILEWTGRSWRVIGYDGKDAFFTIIPPDRHGPKGVISIATTAEPTIVEWHPNTFFPAGILVEEYNSVWQCIRGHTSGSIFEQNFWQSRPDLRVGALRAPRVTTYARGLPTTQRVPYGTELPPNYQDVADFLLGWQRWLVSRGWIFDDIDPTSGEVRDWSLSVKEFLTWAQVQWAPGNFIALSPGLQHLKFSAPTGLITNVESDRSGFFGLLDRSSNPIGQRDAIVNRIDGDITIHAKNADIFCARLDLIEMEHTLVFSNVTIFDDVVYLPLYNIRQPRLRLICKRSQNWTGRMDAPGFMIIGNTLASDFEKAAEDVRLMFDIETPDRSDLRKYARHNIGFQERDYMTSLVLSDVEQFEFYSGMIQQKGAPGVFHKLMRSNRASNNSNLQFLEEWAIRVDEFGAPLDPFLTFHLNQVDMRDDPQIIRFVPTNTAPLDWVIAPSGDSRWVDQPRTLSSFFTMQPALAPPRLPTAGPVRLSEATYTVFYLTDLPDLYQTLHTNGQTPFPTGSSSWVYDRGDGSYTVMRSFETADTPNSLSMIETFNEDPDISHNTMRLFFTLPLTLDANDVGNYLVIDGQSGTVPEIRGLVTIAAVDLDANTADVTVANALLGHTYSERETPPVVRVLREVRFADRSALLATDYAFAVGDRVWIDTDLNNGWVVLQWSDAWDIVRQQPVRPDPTTISETVIYRAGTAISGQEMFIDEPVVDDVVVIDPLAGLIAGLADRDIDYRLNSDPARYNANGGLAANAWGANEVGRVWWNLATVRFLDPCTDTLGISDQRDYDELDYRIAAWSRIAPNTSVDVYEWVESTVSPANYTGPGTLLGGDAANFDPTTLPWAERTAYDTQFGRMVTLYYFWVKGLTTTPSVPFRHVDISTIALAIKNPSGLNLAWLAPIHQDALVISGVAQYLNDTTTVLKIRLTPTHYAGSGSWSVNLENAGRHNQWMLMRPTDETSLPSWQIWQKLRDSLAGFDSSMQPIPDPALSALRATGVRRPQSMFITDGLAGPRTGLLAARQSFVGIVNEIMGRSPMRRDRLPDISTLYRSTLRTSDTQPIDPLLVWAQPNASYVVEPPPHNEWDVEVFSIADRNRLLGRSDFLAAATNRSPNIRVLVNGMANPRMQWSIWEFDAAAAHTVLTAGGSLGDNADSLFSVATAYDRVVNTVADRNALSLTDDGRPRSNRILVIDGTNRFWAIYRYAPTSQRPPADAYGFVLWRVQSYRTDDFIDVVDWYAEGYSASNPPITTYETISDRNAAPNFISAGNWPISIFVKVNDDGTSQGDPSKKRWIWSAYDTTVKQWQTVAMQGGTIALSDNFFDPTRTLHAVDVWRSVATTATAGATSLTLDSTTGVVGGQFVIGPGIAHTTTVTTVNGLVITLDTPLTADVLAGTMIGVTTITTADISTRDGSWELFVLADALRYGTLLSDKEINEIWFSVLNFAHVQQDSLDWAFATSFMTIIGYNVPLQQTPVLLADQTPSLVSYIEEVKPYHVKIRDFSSQYNPDIDLANTHVADSCGFDVTLLFDRCDVDDAWDIRPWAADRWDSEGERTLQVYVHTKIIAANATDIQVDDIRFLQVGAAISDDNQLAINILDDTTSIHSYQITAIATDDVNVSSTSYQDSHGTIHVVGVSGQLGATTSIAGDVVAGMIVEAVVEIPDKVLREVLYNPAAQDASMEWWMAALGTDMRPSLGLYTTSIDAHAGDTSLLLNNVTNVAVGQPVFGPNIQRGTLISSISGSLITISLPILQNIVAGSSIVIGLPIWLSGGDLADAAADVTYDGSDLADVTPDTMLNPSQESRPGGYDFRAVYYDADHPQERVPFYVDDALHLLVTSLATAGGPPQSIRAFDVHEMTSPATLFFNFVAQSAAAVLVYRDGVRLQLGTDYTVFLFGLPENEDVDRRGPAVRVNLLADSQQVMVHAFGFGGTSAIDDASYLSFAGNPLTIPEETTADNCVVVVNGEPTTDFTVDHDQVTLTSAPALDSDVAIVVYHGDPVHSISGAETATQISVLPYAYNIDQQWTLDPHDDQTVPEHAGTIVEVNGLRLMPSATYYGHLTPDTPWMPIGVDPPGDPSQVTVWVDGAPYGQTVPVCTTTDPGNGNLYHLVVPGPMPSPPGQFVFYQNYLIALDTSFTGDVVVAIKDATIGSTPLNADYTVEDGELTVLSALSEDIQVTIFSNASSMDMQTTVYAADSDVPFVVSMPDVPYYTLVTLNGTALTPEDYTIAVTDVTGPFTAGTREAAVLTLNQSGTGPLVITSFTKVAEELHQWMSNTRVPASLRMPLVYDAAGHQLTGLPNNGPLISKKLHGLRDEYVAVSPYMAGTLVDDLAVTDTEMTVQLYLRDISPKLAPSEPFRLPTPLSPGAVWISGERIEYFGYERLEENVVKLRQLRRATRGTSSSDWDSGSIVYNGDLLIAPDRPRVTAHAASSPITGIATASSAGNPTTSPHSVYPALLGVATSSTAGSPTTLPLSRPIVGVTGHGAAGTPSITTS